MSNGWVTRAEVARVGVRLESAVTSGTANESPPVDHISASGGVTYYHRVSTADLTQTAKRRRIARDAADRKPVLHLSCSPNTPSVSYDGFDMDETWGFGPGSTWTCALEVAGPLRKSGLSLGRGTWMAVFNTLKLTNPAVSGNPVRIKIRAWVTHDRGKDGSREATPERGSRSVAVREPEREPDLTFDFPFEVYE